VRGGDERTVAARSGKDDVPRLVAHQQGTGDARRVTGDVDDADAVGEVVDDPHLGIGPSRDGDRFEADLDGTPVHDAASRDVEQLQPLVRRVDGEESAAVRRECQRPDLPTLERGEGGGRCRSREPADRAQHGERSGTAPCPAHCHA
jgi:hypothetical protein